jgi:hypothetical protein
MKCDDLLVGEELVQIFGDILRIPGVPSEAKDQGRILSRLIRRNSNPGELVPFCRLQRQPLGAFGPGASAGDGMGWKNQVGLKVEHVRD